MSLLLQKSKFSEYGSSEPCKSHAGGGASARVKFNGGEGGGSPRKLTCCVPGRPCQFYGEPIRLDEDDVVRMECSNETCRESGWMHADCFETWEKTLLTYMRSCGRARQWNDKQRAQNLWTKKGYDLVRPACACRCGSGFVRKDLSYVPAFAGQTKDEDRRQKRHRRRSEPVSNNSRSQLYSSSSSSSHPPSVHQHHHHSTRGDILVSSSRGEPFRSRTVSMSSGGSSPPCSSGSESSSPPSSPESDDTAIALFAKSGLLSSSVQAVTGNIFQHRNDFDAFRDLPVTLRNPYHIKLEDEGQFGNDETRSFILVTLSVQNVTAVDCVLCGHSMPVFDKYPLIDGTFFLSPRRYNTDLRVRFHGQKRQYMNAVCFRCMIGAKRTLQCRFCKKPWNGSTLVIGSMYAYDVFAAMPCCAAHQTCSGCQRHIVGPKMQFFSDYSRSIVCPHCRKEDHHFVKPIDEFYYIL